MRVRLLWAAVTASLLAVQVHAQAPAVAPAPVTAASGRTPLKVPPVVPYGMPISLEQAKKAVAVIEAEIVRRKLTTVTFAIVEPSGELVFYEKATHGPYAAWDMAMSKARSAARETRPTSFDRDRLLNGENFLLAFKDVYPTGGGVPIIVDGHTIGGIGVTGGADEILAQMGADAVK
jgi:glc operon protein GlcG